MLQNWLWLNRTQVGFGLDAVKTHMKKFVAPRSRVICTFGGGSIEKNGARQDVQEALEQLECTVTWEGGIPANPEYDRLMEIVAVVKETKPDWIIAVGGGSVLDGTKFICAAAGLADGVDAWETILMKGEIPETPFTKIASVMTLPATGSEWNSNFVISRRSINMKQAGGSPATFPVFSLLDPKYTETLPERQLRNGVYDAMTHCIDQFLTGQVNPMMDRFWMSVMKELVTIGKDVVYNPTLELRERLIVAATFALNLVFTLGKEGCWGIHMIGHQLTAKYNIDHGASLAIVGPTFLETQFEARKTLLAQCAEYVFDVTEGTEDEKARAFIAKLRDFIRELGQPEKVSDWQGAGAVIQAGDVNEVTKMVMVSVGNQPYGWRGQITEEVTKLILQQVIC